MTLDHGAYAVWNGTCYIVTSPNRVEQIQSAITVAYIYVLTDDERDAKHAELMALKGQGEPCAPSWWVNVEHGYKWGYAYSTEAFAREQHVRNVERIAVPVYEYPPAATPRAPQKRDVLGHAVIREGEELSLFTTTFHPRTTRDRACYEATHYGGTVVELLRGDDVPLVRGDVTEGGR